MSETPRDAAWRLAAPAIREGYVPEALHCYTGASGAPFFWRIRLKHPDGRKWIRPMRMNGAGYELGEPECPDGKPLYRLHELAARPREPTLVVEGEWCADAVAPLGVLATTSGGADSAGRADWRPLAGRAVTIWPDFDHPGRRYAEAVTAALLPLGCTVRIIDVARLGLPDGGDVVDWLRMHPDATKSDIEVLATIEAESTDSLCHEDEKRTKKSAATMLVELAQERYRFAVSHDGETYAVPLSGPEVVATLRGNRNALRGQLARDYFRRTGRAAPQQALADALLVIDGMAQEALPQPLHLRVAGHDGALWIDMGDATGRAIRISDAGWTIEHKAPVLFKRTALTGVLPEPVLSGTLGELWSWLNVTEEDQPLVAAWLVAALFPDIPHPVLGIFGEQGTGKTTSAKVLVSVLDPSPVPIRKPPKDADSWVTAVAGSWVVGIDNLSDIAPWLSDSLCRAVTGDGDVRRKLYTDCELAVFAYRRCVIINGIDVGAMRGDLADRMLTITLDAISEEDRLEEDDLWPAWQQVHPRLLGAVLDLAAGVIAAFRSVRLERKPRMADFARVLGAVDRVLGTRGLATYISKQGEIATDSLTGDAFIIRISETVTDFRGTAAELLTEVTPTEETWRAPKGWPGNARAVTQRLNRQAPVMRKAGWKVEHDDGRNHTNRVRWTIIPPRAEMAGNSDSRDSQDAGGASHASHGSGQSQDDYDARSVMEGRI